MQIEKEQDVVSFRNRVREFAVKLGMSLVNQTKLITAASELVRNMLKYANGGSVLIETISQGRDNGIRLISECILLLNHSFLERGIVVYLLKI